MSVSIFDDKLVEPDAKMLSVVLGETQKFYETICQFIHDEYGDLRPEWKFYPHEFFRN